MAKSPTPAEPDKLSRRQQFRQTYQMAEAQRPAPRPWVLGAGLLGALVGFGVFWLAHRTWRAAQHRSVGASAG